MVRELALVANCVMCDTYFMQVISLVDLQAYKGLHGKDALFDEKYIPLQKKFTSGEFRVQFLACPTCTELCNGVKYKEFATNEKMSCALSLCHFVIFDDDEQVYKIKSISTPPKKKIVVEDAQPLARKQSKQKDNASNHDDWDIYKGVALYMDMSEQSPMQLEAKKPKWELILGQGPQRIELDSSRSGRIYKQSLKQLALKIVNAQVFQHNENVQCAEYEKMIEKVNKCVQSFKMPNQVVQCFNDEFLPMKPMLAHWEKVDASVLDKILAENEEE